MTLTVGENSYIDVDDADEYFSTSLSGDAWSELDGNVKERALVTATKMIDRQTWAGTKTDPDQDLQWPRTGVSDKYGNAVDPNEVPQNILDATCELALAIYQDPSIQTNSSTSTNTKRLKAGSAEIEYFRPTTGGRFPTVIQELLGQYLASSVRIATGEAFGTDQCSSFDKRDPRNNFNVNDGY